MPYRRVSQPDLPNVGIGSPRPSWPQRIRLGPVPLTSKGKEMSMKSSRQIHLEMIEQTLQPTSCFQLQAAKHKVLVIRDALADDKEYCEALVLKIEHLLGQETVPAVNRSTSVTVASAADTKELRSAA